MRRREDLPFRGRVEGRFASSPPDILMNLELEPPRSPAVMEPMPEVVTIAPNPDGRFEFWNLLPGPYQLWFVGTSGRITGQSVRVYAHQVTRVEVEIGR